MLAYNKKILKTIIKSAFYFYQIFHFKFKWALQFLKTKLEKILFLLDFENTLELKSQKEAGPAGAGSFWRECLGVGIGCASDGNGWPAGSFGREFLGVVIGWASVGNGWPAGSGTAWAIGAAGAAGAAGTGTAGGGGGCASGASFVACLIFVNLINRS